MPPPLNPHARACAPQREATAMRSLRDAIKNRLRSPQLNKACAQQQRPGTAKIINQLTLRKKIISSLKQK